MAKQEIAKRDAKHKPNACYLYSKANYSIVINYDGKEVVLPPNAIDFKLADESKVGALPKTVRKVIIKGDN